MQYTLIYENADGINPKNPLSAYLYEAIFAKHLDTSGITSKTLDSRMTNPEYDNTIGVDKVDYSNNAILKIYFYAKPTKSATASVILANGSKSTASSYSILLQFNDVDKYLTDKQTFANLSSQEKPNLIQTVFNNCPIKLYSSDPSFYYSSAWEKLATIDGAAINFPGPAGDDVWYNRHKNSGGMGKAQIPLTKHIRQILDEFDVFVPTIANLIK